VNAWTQHFLGNHAEGDRALAAAIQASGDGPMPDGASSIDATAALMRGAFPGGDVGAMLSAARRAYELEGGRDSPWRTTVHVLLGFALVRAGHYEEARKPLVAGAEMAMRSNLWMDAIGAETLLSRVDVEAGDDATAERLATEAVELADVHGMSQTPTGAYARAALAVARLRRGDPATAERLLADAMPLARAIGEPLLVAEMLIPLGQAQQAQGHQASANAAFREADAIIESLPDPGVLRPTRHHRAKTTPPALPLSDRELEVLVALSRGLSKREVAAELFVSYNTVHSHVRSIYRKLDVRSRNDAVSAARQRGLLA
jgi:LuxR family maltose regulon positive regulatory protein